MRLEVGDRVFTEDGFGVVVELDLEPEFPRMPAVRVELDRRDVPTLASWYWLEDLTPRAGDG